MNRTDRLYAMVEELRAAAPGSRTARQLAERFEVSSRTIERDILALQEAGVPIFATPGRRGGYAIDREHTLPPVNFTPAEATAVAVALAGHDGPFAVAGRRARDKVLAAMSTEDADAARALGRSVRLMVSEARPPVPSAVQEAIADRAVMDITYADREQRTTQRRIEPIAVLSIDKDWYLVAWCRLRDDARMFRLDRILASTHTGEAAPQRNPDDFLGAVSSLIDRPRPFE